MVSADLLLFLIWLNFLPFLAHLLLGERWAWPLDASRRLWDGRLVLFPAVRKAEATTIVSAPGTSCRHQIKDGTGRIAQHPVEVLYDALKEG